MTYLVRCYTALFGLLLTTATASVGLADELRPELRHSQVSRLVTDFIEKSHYRKAKVDDELSSMVFDNYLDTLDGNRSYFIESDIQAFEKYRFRLDNAVQGNYSLQPVFEMFERYRERALTQLGYARDLLSEEPDFAKDEVFRFDREDEPWLRSEAELNDFWRQRVKNDALSLLLAGKTWEEAAETLDKRYKQNARRFEQLNNDDVFETFMNAFAHTLDPHSSYFSPRNAEEYRIQMALSYFGIGASLISEDDYVTIQNIIAGGPAFVDETLQKGDRITAVGQGSDGELVDVIGWRLDDVVDLIRGKEGTTVRLSVLPEGALPGAPEDVLALTRGKVKLEDQAAQKKVLTVPREDREWRIGVIEIPSFYRDYEAQQRGDKDFRSTTKDVRRLIEELESDGEGIDGLVVDLRNNGGGHLSEATALSGLFINRGPIVQLRDTHGNIDKYRDPIPLVAYSGPLTVLVNRFSASASEIFAAAIQDYERGVVVGQQTFGKGTVQNLYPLDQYFKPPAGESFGQLTLTIGKYYRVTGGSTQNRGVEPDIELPSLIDATLVGESTRDSALPWDEIDKVRFRAGKPLDTLIGELSVGYRQRLASNPDLDYLVGNIEALQESRHRKSVSLNIDERRIERESFRAESLARENERRSALGLEPYETIEAMEKAREDDELDIWLDEAAAIATDQAILRLEPTQTRQARL
ncbi:MAG: carboxy terminal-processing peptidase [Pseudomonadota bacterium]